MSEKKPRGRASRRSPEDASGVADSSVAGYLGLLDLNEIAPTPQARKGLTALFAHQQSPSALIPIEDVRDLHVPVKLAFDSILHRLRAALGSGTAAELDKWADVVDRLRPLAEGYLNAVHDGPCVGPLSAVEAAILRDGSPAGISNESRVTIEREAVKSSIESKLRDALILRDKLRLKASEIRHAAGGDAGPWSKPDSPSRWATKFGISPKTFKRHVDAKKIRAKRLSDKLYQVHVDDVPEQR